jgi:rhamnosyltransferase
MKNKMPRIAVLLAAYNGQEWIEEQISTIENQENVQLNVFISLDVSTDNTQKLIEELARKYANITLLPYGQRFGSAAPNFFHLLTTVSFDEYDYVALADQDDVWLSDKISHAIRKIEGTDSQGYSSDVTAFWPDGKERIIKKSYPQKKFDHYFEGPGPGCTFVITKKLALLLKENLIARKDALSGIDWHDWYVYMFARHNGFKWFIDDACLMRYRQHSTNQLGANSGLKPFIKRLKSVCSGYAIQQATCNVRTLNTMNSFVDAWMVPSRKGLLFLLSNSFQCRRKAVDTLFFSFSCLMMLVFYRRMGAK